MQIYISRDGVQQSGPFSLDDVRAQLRSGTIQPTDLAWFQGVPDWAPIASIPEIMRNAAPRLAVQPPPIPTYSATASTLGSAVAPEKPNKSKIVITMIISGVFGLICFIIALSVLTDGMQRNHTFTPTVIMGIVGAIAGFSLAFQMFGALNHRSGACQCCGRPASTIKVTLNRHIGAVLLMFHKSHSGAFCKDCISKTFWEYTLTTALLGWWGMISFFITPIVLTNNVVSYARSLFMKDR